MKLQPAIPRIVDVNVFAMRVGETDVEDLYGFVEGETYAWLGVVYKTVELRDGLEVRAWVARTTDSQVVANTRKRAVELLMNENGLFPVGALQTIPALF